MICNLLDHCPTCNKHINDFMENGCESPTGQRYCIIHLPAWEMINFFYSWTRTPQMIAYRETPDSHWVLGLDEVN